GIKMIIWHLVRGKMRLGGFCARKIDIVREKMSLGAIGRGKSGVPRAVGVLPRTSGNMARQKVQLGGFSSDKLA
uniref:hypothetical protein n=1 Tax=Klebsiella pneumoniae TaxID=573 RepID=UPI001C5DAC73